MRTNAVFAVYVSKKREDGDNCFFLYIYHIFSSCNGGGGGGVASDLDLR